MSSLKAEPSDVREQTQPAGLDHGLHIIISNGVETVCAYNSLTIGLHFLYIAPYNSLAIGLTIPSQSVYDSLATLLTIGSQSPYNLLA